MSKLPASTIFDLDINLIGAAAAVDSFGRPCIVHKDAAHVGGPVVTLCGSIQDVAALGFAEYSPVYQMAAWLLSQEKRPASFYVAVTGTFGNADLTAVESSGSWYTLLATTRTAADIQAIATWVETVAASRHMLFAETQDAAAFGTGASVLSALETADRLRTAVVARLGDPRRTSLRISAPFVALNSTTLDVNGTGIGPVVYAVSSDSTLTALAVALAATDEIASATVTSVAGGTEDDREIIIVDADPLNPSVISDYACTLGASQNTIAIAELDSGTGASDAALLGKLLPQGLAKSTAHGKTLKGLETDDLSTAQYAAVTGHGGNCYVTIGGVKQIQKGQTSGFVAPGQHAFIDTIAMRDMIEADVQQAVIAVLTPQVGKLPFDNSGIRAVANAAIGVCQRYADAKVLMPFSPLDDWSIPDISEIPAADVTARHLPSITGNVRGTGAIQSVGMTINITV